MPTDYQRNNRGRIPVSRKILNAGCLRNLNNMLCYHVVMVK